MITELAYEAFSKHIHDSAGIGRFPMEGSIEVTERCNLACAHCYINQPSGNRAIQQKELTDEQWCGIIDQIVQAGCLWLLITGGEPFIRPDFLNIYAYAKKKGLLITIFTNGTALTPKIVDYLAQYPPFNIEISIYGCTRNTFEQVTTQKGSYDQCMRGIDLILDRNLPLALKTALIAQNQHELDDMRIFADRLGVPFRFDPEINHRVDGSNKPALHRVSPEQIVEFEFQDKQRVLEWKNFAKYASKNPIGSDQLYQCGAGQNSFHISAYGKMSLCIMTRHESYDLLSGSFDEGWSQFFPKILGQQWTKKTECSSCTLNSLCSWCPGHAILEHNDPQTQVEYLCAITHLRAKKLNIPVKELP